MSFIVHVACDVGGGKLNTGIEFPRRPSTLTDLVTCVEALYTAEARVQSGDPNRTFECVAIMKLAHFTGSDKSQWIEVHDIAQLETKSQLFVFDKHSPSPNKGPIPKVQFIVGENQVRQILRNDPPPTPAATVQTPPRHRPAPASTPMQHVKPSASFSDHTATLKAPSSAIPNEARDFLFEQLCRTGDGRNVSAQRLHAIFVENGLMFTTEAFAFITEGRHLLDYDAWNRIAIEFPPLIDALYDRIATRTVRHSANGELVLVDGRAAIKSMKDEMQALEEEEHQLLLRQAAIKQRLSELQRDIRDEEEREAKAPNSTTDRAKEWDMLQKFVSLRMRQQKLRDEDASITHQLTLL